MNGSIISAVIAMISMVIGYFLQVVSYWAKDFIDSRKIRKLTVDDLLYPLVRVSDELVGRTYHHAKEDFKRNEGRPETVDSISNPDQLYDVYLWARFWAHTSAIRKNILSYNLSQTQEGKSLLRFLDCLEAIKVSIVPRSYQRLVGDAFSDELGLKEGVSYYRFAKIVQKDPFFAETLDGVNMLFVRAFEDKEFRREFVKYTIVIHAMVEYLDEKKSVSSTRSALANKLDHKHRNDLKHRIFRRYTPLSGTQMSKYL